jgi:hypothetical protein
MGPVDVTRLKEAARFLKEGEIYVVTMADLQIKLTQGDNWLHVGMASIHTGYTHGRNLNQEMQTDNNIEYWIYKEVKHMNEEIAQIRRF